MIFLIKWFWLKNNENGLFYSIAGIEQQWDWHPRAAYNIKLLLRGVNKHISGTSRENISELEKTEGIMEDISTAVVTLTKV